MSKQKEKSSSGQETIAYIFGVLGALIFGYVSFFNHNISVWVAFLGACTLLIGIAIYAQGKLRPRYLYSFLGGVLLIDLIVTIALQINEPEKATITARPIIQSKDSLIAILTDSIQKSKSFIAVAESIRIYSSKKIETAEHYFQVENSPSMRAEYISIDIKPNDKITCTIMLTNYGKTIATKVTSSNYFVSHTVDNYDKFTLNETIRLPIQDLHPSQQKTMINETEKAITKEYYDALVSQKLFLYNYGRIIYQDASHKHYISDYCIVYNFPKGLFLEIPNPKFSYEK